MHDGGKTFFLCLTLSHVSSVPHSVEKREKKAFHAGKQETNLVQINPTVSILVRELTVFFHYNLKLKSQPFSVFDLESIFNTLACVGPPSLK